MVKSIMALRFRTLTAEDEQFCMDAHAMFSAEEFDFLVNLDGRTWPEYLEFTDRHAKGVNLDPDRVRADFFLAVNEADQIIGRVSIRYGLTDWLENFGGHIGYGVLPEFRRRGYATQILERGLWLLKEAGIDRVLVTCLDHNLASATVIEKCGGVLEDKRQGADGLMRRYWIDND